jgi:hypothetical protein
VNRKINFLHIILVILVVNTAGFLLKYFELDNYIILLGFRFHLSLVLPFLLIIKKIDLSYLKRVFLKPEFKGKFFLILWIILPVTIIFLSLYLSNKIKLGDPEYFYEFGLSSIFDFPIYLIWNIPQLLFLFLFLIIISESRSRFFIASNLLPFLFVYEFILIDENSINYFYLFNGIGINYFDLSIVIISALCCGLILQFFQNVYWFSILFFSLFWINLLAFGSKSEKLINLLFASQYSEWEGFFVVSKEYNQYTLIAHIVLLLILLTLSIPFGRKKVVK